jgi:hypothetical protein
MFRNIKILITLLSLSLYLTAYSQEQNQEKKNPIELAAEQADKLEIDLKLNHKQHFLVDSVLQKNIAGVMAEFEQMQKGGMQNPESYREVQQKWFKKTEEAFKKFLTPEQFEKYLRLSGVPSKERKKRKQDK